MPTPGKLSQTVIHLTPVVQRMDRATAAQLTIYVLDNSTGFASVYPLNSDLS